MSIPRIYQTIPLDIQTKISLDAWGIQHVKALRLRLNDELMIFNGNGKNYLSTVVDLTKKSVSVNLLSEQLSTTETSLKTHLIQAISRGERMDYTIQKATELGVTSITPVISERCEIKLTNDRWQKKQHHWQQIAISACEQSGRTVIPCVNSPQYLDAVVENINDVGLILDPDSPNTLKDLDSKMKSTASIFLLVGPEGGLTQREVQEAKSKGYTELRLGPRILRTETAAPALLAALQARWGDFLE